MADWPLMDARSGAGGTICTFDHKHLFKRVANKARNLGMTGTGVQEGGITADILVRFLRRNGTNSRTVDSLLRTTDPQDVPRAVTLIREIAKLDRLHQASQLTCDLAEGIALAEMAFFGKLFSFFLEPFVDATMSLSRQLSSLATASHLLLFVYRILKGNFISSELYHDIQQSVISVFNTTFLLKRRNDPLTERILLLDGTDELEKLFGIVRMMSHNTAVDAESILQRFEAVSMVARILARKSNWYRGHQRLSVQTHNGDNLNPTSVVAGVRVAFVDPAMLWSEGADKAVQVMRLNTLPPSAI